MAASGQIRPSSGYNNIGTDYISPVTPASDIDICTTSGATVPIARFKNSLLSVAVDNIDELTPANGVDIDGALLKDGGIRLANNVALSSRNAADSANLEILKLNASNVAVFTAAQVAAATRNSLALGGTYTDAFASSGVATSIAPAGVATILALSPTLEADEIVLYYITGSISGSANAQCTLVIQVDGVDNIVSNYQHHDTSRTDAKSFPFTSLLIQTAPSAAAHTYRLVITATGGGTIYYRDFYAVCLRIRNNR